MSFLFLTDLLDDEELRDAITLDDDIITVKDDKEYSTKERTVFLKQPLDGSWIVCAVVKEMGDAADKTQPIIIGIIFFYKNNIFYV